MSEFHFLRPWWLIALIPTLLLVISLWRHRSKGSSWNKVIAPHLLQRLWLDSPGKHSRLPLILLGLGWLLAILALAGPVWERLPEPVWQTQASRVLILDLSPSMNAADLAPSRLERARFKIQDILNSNREGRTGLVVFSAEPHTVAPLTDDGDTVANLLAALSTDIVPAAGDSVAPALELAGKLLKQANAIQGDVLLLSDGIADPAASFRAAQALQKQGYRLSVLAVGTAQGAPIPDNRGGTVMARLDAAALQELARTGGGEFSLLTADDSDLAKVLREPPRTSPGKQMDDSGVERWVERGVWLLPLLALIGAAGFRRGWLTAVVAVMVLPPPAEAFEWQDLWLRQDQQAARKLNQGQAKEAAEQFSNPAWRGMALYQSGDYAEAAKAFADSKEPSANYNRGNALAKGGQLEQAAEAYREVLEQQPDHADAKANLALVEKLLQQQKPQQQNQQQSDSSKQEQSDNNQDQASQQEQQSQSQQGKEGKHKQDSKQQEKGQQDGKQDDHKESPQQESSGAEKQNQAQADEQPQDSQEAARKDVEQQVEQQQESSDQKQLMPEQSNKQPTAENSSQAQPTEEKQLNEKEMAMEQWLRQIPEDPAGLLRRKFMLEHLKRKKSAE